MATTTEPIVVGTSTLARGLILVLGALFVVAFAINLVHRRGGHGPGAGTLIALGLLAVVALAGVVMVFTSKVSYDPRARVLTVNMMGKAQSRELGPTTTIEIRAVSTSNGMSDKYVVVQQGQPSLSFYGTINGDPGGIKRLLRAALADNPRLVAEYDQRLLR